VFGIRGTVGSALEYARRQELGFFGTDSAGRSVKHEARPYLRPSILEKRREILNAIGRGRL
jgi:hypothetical protein